MGRPRAKNGFAMLPAPQGLRVESDGKISVSTASQFSADIKALVTKVNGGISFGNGEQGSQSGNVDGHTVQIKFPSAPDTEATIPHGLARRPIGYVVLSKDRACDVYDSSRGSWNDDFLYLKCTVADATVLLILV